MLMGFFVFFVVVMYVILCYIVSLLFPVIILPTENL